MRTTINDLIGRRGGACDPEEVQDLLGRTRRICADLSAMLELELDQLFAMDFDDAEPGRLDKIIKLIRENQKALQMVLDIEAKLGLSTNKDRPGAGLDLEEARAEITRRLDRLVA